jgi:Protein of unknown function (DUF3102)
MTRRSPQEKTTGKAKTRTLARISAKSKTKDASELRALTAAKRERRLDHQAVLTHAAKINIAWQKAVSSIIETGQLLIEAKEGKKKLPHGEFLKLFDPQIGNLPFSERTAQQLMQIARHPVLSNAIYRSDLPPHWRTLAILSRAPPEQLKDWLNAHVVVAETEQVEAEALVNPPANHPDRAAPLSSGEEVVIETDPVEPDPPAAAASDDDDSDDAEDDASEFPPFRPFTEEDNDEVEIGVCCGTLKRLDNMFNDARLDWKKVIESIGSEKIRDIIEKLKSKLDDNRAASPEKTTLN